MRMRLAATAAVVSLLSGLSLAQTAPTSQPATLKLGDPAPPLKVSKWLKGGPVASFEPGKIYVVDFWATWCVECVKAIPHTSALAKRYPNDVVVIGMNVKEDDVADVAPFMTEMGPRMEYRVAMDDIPAGGEGADGAMAKTWLATAGKDGLPWAYVIDQKGKLAFIGHPLELDPVVEQLKAGTFDPQATAKKQERAATVNDRIKAAARAKDVDGYLASTKELAEMNPADAEAIAVNEYQFLARNGRPDAARTRADKLARTSRDPLVLNTVAWAIATGPAPQDNDLAIARVAVDRAIEIAGNKEADYFDTSARVYAAQKNWPKAVETINQALALAPADVKASMQRSLDAYSKQQLPE